MNELNLIEEGGSVPVYDDALKFDSTYNDAVNIGSNFVTGARTVSFWLKPNITTFNGMTRQFLCVQYGSSNQRTFLCEFFSNGLLRCYFSTTTSGNSYGDIYSDAGVYFNANQWYHVCFTIESSGLTKMYIDGVQQVQTHPNTLQLSRTGAPLYWGGFGPYLTNSWSDSTMKELAIWTVERSQADVNADMTRTWTGAESGLKAYFPTNEGSGNTIQDINGVYTGNIVTTNPSPTYIDDFMWVREIVGSTGGSIEKSSIDLFENQFVSITKQSFDVNNLKQRLSGVTNNFTLPFTANNSEIFDYLDLNGNTSNKPYQLNYVEYIQDGTPIIKKGRMNLKELSDAGYKVDVTHGINDFFDRIRDKYFHEPFVDRSPNGISIGAANFSNYAQPVFSSISGVTFPIINYSQSNPLPEYQSTPYAKVADAFNFIAEDSGYSFIDNTNGRLDNRLFGGGKLFEYKEERQDITGFFNLSGIGDTTVNTYYTKRTGVLFNVYSLKFEVLAGLGFNIGIYTYADGVQIGFYGISPASLGTFTDYSGFQTTSPNVYPKGTKIETVISITTNPSADLRITFGDYGHPDTSGVGVVESGTCYLDNVFGDISQIEFMSYIFELFNLGFEVDELNKQVTAYSLNDVYNPNSGNTIDLSDYYSNVMTKKFESSFGKINNFKYQYQDGRPEIYNGTLVANNVNKNKDLVNSDLTASFHDQTIDLSSFKPFVMKANGYEDSQLDTASNDIGNRVVNYNFYDASGSYPSSIQVFGIMSFDVLTYAGTTTTSSFSQLTLTNSDGLDWSSLIEENYSSLRDHVLNRYQEVKVLMRVPRHLIDTFSFQNKIFISQLNTKFVVQSIKTRPDGLSEWVLIKLN